MTNIPVIEVETYLIKRQENFFGTLGATPNRIASNIAGDALVMGCTAVSVWTQDGWWLISGNVDWISIPNRSGVNHQNVFETIWGMPEAGQIHYWSPVMARVFASATATRRGNDTSLIKGTPADLQQFLRISAEAPHLNLVIGFKFQAAV